MIDTRAEKSGRAVTRTMFVVTATLAIGALCAACGGSATESPWPVEPDNLVTSPEGEEGSPKAKKDRRADSSVDPEGKTDRKKPVAAPNVEP